MNIHINTSEIARAFRGTYATGGIIPKPIPFRIGSRVKVTGEPCSFDGDHSYHGRYIGCYGEIVRLPEICSCSCRDEAPVITIGVLLDGKHNERSQYGCYWFKPEELYVITEEEKENNKMLLLKGYKIAQVATEGYGDQYVAHYEETLEEGDRVVVANDEGYHCGIVSNVFTEAHMNRITKFQIVCKIDDSAFCERIDRAKKARELEGKLKTAVADYQQIALYEMLAEKSPEIAALLKELKEVTNV